MSRAPVTERNWTRASLLVGAILTIASIAALVGSSSAQSFAAAFPNSVKEFFGATAGLSGVVAGFIITAKAILLGLPASGRTGRTIRRTSLHDVVSMMRVTAMSAILVGLLSCLLILLSGSTRGLAFRISLALWLGISATTTITFLRFMHGFGELSTAMMKDRRSEAERNHRAASATTMQSFTDDDQPSTSSSQTLPDARAETPQLMPDADDEDGPDGWGN